MPSRARGFKRAVVTPGSVVVMRSTVQAHEQTSWVCCRRAYPRVCLALDRRGEVDGIPLDGDVLWLCEGHVPTHRRRDCLLQDPYPRHSEV